MSHPVKFADEGCSSLKVSNHHRHIIYCITYWGRDAGRGRVFAALKVISVEAGHAQSGRGRATGRGQRARPAPGPDRGRGEGDEKGRQRRVRLYIQKPKVGDESAFRRRREDGEGG